MYGLGTILIQSSGFILLPLYTRYLEPADFGLVEILERTASFISVAVLANGIATAAFSYYCQANDAKQQATVSSTVTLATILGMLAGFAMSLCFSKQLGAFLTIEDSRLVVLGIAASLCGLLPGIQLALMQAKTQSGRFVLASLGITCARVGLILLAVAYFHLGIWGVLIGTIIANLGIGIVLFAWETIEAGFHPSGKTLGEILRFAWPFAPTGILSFFLFNTDRFFLLKTVGASELGVYALASKIGVLVGSLAFTPFFKVWSAHLYKVFARENAAIEVGRAYTGLLFPFVFFGLAVCLFQTEVVYLLGTEDYYGAVPLIPLTILANFFLTAQILLDGAFYYKQKTTAKIYITLIATAFHILVCATLIPSYKVLGACIAVVASMIVLAGTTLLFSQRVAYVKIEWNRLIVMLGSAAIFCLVNLFLPWGLFSSTVRLFVLCLWPAMLFYLGFLTDYELESLGHLRRDVVRLYQQWRHSK